jgi:hypothetical protein
MQVNPAVDLSTSVEKISPTLKLRGTSQRRDPGGGGSTSPALSSDWAARPARSVPSEAPWEPCFASSSIAKPPFVDAGQAAARNLGCTLLKLCQQTARYDEHVPTHDLVMLDGCDFASHGEFFRICGRREHSARRILRAGEMLLLSFDRQGFPKPPPRSASLSDASQAISR